jgi:hypothetical protein
LLGWRRNLRRKCIRKEDGNALFLILIAVTLFAGLSYAITRSGRGGGTIERENALIGAAEISDFFGAVNHAVARLRVITCADTQITFENSVYEGGGSGPYSSGLLLPPGSNPNSPTDKSCHVFDVAGGGIVPKIIKGGDGAGTDWSKSGHPWFVSEPMPGIGSTASDLVMIMPHVSIDVCRAYNKAVGVGGSTGDPIGGAGGSPEEIDLVFTTFNGTYTDCCVSNGIPSGTWSACYRYNNLNNQLHIFNVLLAR